MAWVAFDRAIKDERAHGLKGLSIDWRRCGRVSTRRSASRFNQERHLRAGLTGPGGRTPVCSCCPSSVSCHPRSAYRLDHRCLKKRLLWLTDSSGAITRDGPTTDCRPAKGRSFVYLLVGRYLCPQVAPRTARAIVERLLSVRNDLGLLSEEYDPRLRRQLGNFPQAFSHVALIDSAYNLSQRESAQPAKQRSGRGGAA